MTIREILAAYPVRPIRGCPGRFVMKADAVFSLEELAEQGWEVTSHHPDSVPDEVLVCRLSDGGLISYRKADGRMINTVNNREGFKRKLTMLGIEEVPYNDEK